MTKHPEYITREDKLSMLFDFYMHILDADNEYHLLISGSCPFDTVNFRNRLDCKHLCGTFFACSNDIPTCFPPTCPCSEYGPGEALIRLHNLLVDEGYISERE